ncbi:hypothetical protein EV182_004578, partial [Spiromyces aspiralis]
MLTFLSLLLVITHCTARADDAMPDLRSQTTADGGRDNDNTRVISKTGQALDLTSVILSIVMLGVAAATLALQSGIVKRSSFRLSVSIALANIIFALCQFIRLDWSAMPSLNQPSLRALEWMTRGANLTYVFINVCIATQLFLTFVTNYHKLALTLHCWYEVASWVSAFFITHPVMYVGDSVVWDEAGSRRIEILSDRRHIVAVNWLCYRVPVIIGLVYCVSMSALVVFHLCHVHRRMNSVHSLSSLPCYQGVNLAPDPAHASKFLRPLDELKSPLTTLSASTTPSTALASATPIDIRDSSTMLANNSAATLHPTFTMQKTRPRINMIPWTAAFYQPQVQFAIVRAMLYPIICVLIQTFPLAVACLDSASIRLSLAAELTLATLGIVNFAQFIINPVFDPVWAWVKERSLL